MRLAGGDGRRHVTRHEKLIVGQLLRSEGLSQDEAGAFHSGECALQLDHAAVELVEKAALLKGSRARGRISHPLTTSGPSGAEVEFERRADLAGPHSQGLQPLEERLA